MTRKALLWCAIVVSSFGCSAASDGDADGDGAEAMAEQQAALRDGDSAPELVEPVNMQKPVCTPTCTMTTAFIQACGQHGGYWVCDDTTAMCCRDSKDINGSVISTLCSSNPNEIRPQPPASPTAPVEPAFDAVK